MKIVSKIYDGLLKAQSLLFEMSVSEYLTIGKHVLKNNKYQLIHADKSSAYLTLFKSAKKKKKNVAKKETK